MSEIEWSRLKAAEINALAARAAAVIVPVGSTEQHGPHLPTQVDSLLVGEIARRAARKAAATTPVVVAPTVLAEHHMSLGGTLSLDFTTFHALLRRICRWLISQSVAGSVSTGGTSAREQPVRLSANVAIQQVKTIRAKIRMTLALGESASRA